MANGSERSYQEPQIGNIVVVFNPFEDGSVFCSVVVNWSDGVEAAAFCEPSLIVSTLLMLVEARGISYSQEEFDAVSQSLSQIISEEEN